MCLLSIILAAATAVVVSLDRQTKKSISYDFFFSFQVGEMKEFLNQRPWTQKLAVLAIVQRPYMHMYRASPMIYDYIHAYQYPEYILHTAYTICIHTSADV